MCSSCVTATTPSWSAWARSSRTIRLLTDRSGLPRRRPLLRVIVDSRLRLPPESRVVKTAKDDVLVLCSFAEEKRKRELQNQGIRVEQVPVGVGDGRPDMTANCAPPGDHGNHQPAGRRRSHDQRGGAGLGNCRQGISLLRAQNSGRARVRFRSPPAPASPDMSDAAYVKAIRLHRFGEDFAVEGYLRDPYGD